MVIGLYVPGDSLLHNLSAGIKLGTLFVFGTALAILSSWWVQVGALFIVLILWKVANLGIQRIKQIGWMIPMFALMAVLVNAYLGSWEQGFVMGIRIITLVLFSMLVTYTTTLDEMTHFFTWFISPIKWIGGNPEMIGFAVSFCLRSIPMIITVMEDIREAQIARGQKANVLHLAVPLIIRLLRISSEISESLDSRGFNARSWR